jgi:ankyrin repeat protein
MIRKLGDNVKPSLDPEDPLFDPTDILGICSGILLLEPGAKFVRLAHFSVKEYLLSARSLSWSLNEMGCHISIVRGSIAYYLHVVSFLEAQEDSRLLPEEDVLSRYPLADYSSRYILNHLTHITPHEHPRLEESFRALLNPSTAFILVHKHLGEHFIDHFFPDHVRPVQILDYWDPGPFINLVVASRTGLTNTVQWLLSNEGIRQQINSDLMIDLDDHPHGPLMYAVRNGHVDTVRLLLEFGAEVNRKDRYGTTALSTACYEEQTEVVKVLLEYGADPEQDDSPQVACADEVGLEDIVDVLGADDNQRDGSPLYMATTHGNVKIAQMLLDAGADVTRRYGNEYGSLLQAASTKDHKKVVRILLAAGANVNQSGGKYGSALQAASEKGHEEVVCVLLAAGANVNYSGGDYGSALQAASKEGHEKVVRMLLAAGANVNSDNGGKYAYGSALQIASTNGHEEVVRILLAAGANVNHNGRDHIYGSALQAALWKGHEEVARRLLAAGANVNHSGGEWGSALQAASYWGREELVRALLDAGADVNQYGGLYESALQAASEQGHEDIVRMLLAAGANVNHSGGKYETALQAALWKGHKAIVRRLLAAGANVNHSRGEWGLSSFGAGS